jgi:hypothetical protein
MNERITFEEEVQHLKLGFQEGILSGDGFKEQISKFK